MDISIIILSYNTKKLTRACINSVLKFSKNIQFEIIVVDNASTDGSLEALKKRKDIILIESEKNLGFAGGNNLGIKIAKGKYILLLNSDTIFHENSCKRMIDIISNNLNIGIASCKLLNEDGSIQKNGGYFPDLWHVFMWSTFIDEIPFVQNLFGSYHPHIGSYYNLGHKQDLVTGAFFLIRREVVDSIKSFDENFFLYVEELEFCYRAKQKGWGVLYTPETSITHLGNASGSSELSILQEYKNLRLFYRIHFGQVSGLLLFLILKINILLRLILKGIIMRRKGAFKVYAKALV